MINVNEEQKKLNDMNETAKMLFFAKVKNAENQREKEYNLEKKFQHSHSIVVYIDDINTIMRNNRENDCPYCYILNDYAKNIYFKTIDQALLAWIDHKHLGINTQYAELAWNMLHPAK